MNTASILGALFGGTVAGWITGRLHFRRTQLKALDRWEHKPDGTVEQQVNAAVEAATALEAQRVAEKGRL